MQKTICSIKFWGIAVLLVTTSIAFLDGYGTSWGDDAGTTSEVATTVSAKDALAEFNDLIGGQAAIIVTL